MRIHCLQHIAFEGLGSLQTWTDTHRHTVTHTRFFAGDALPPLDAFDLLVVLGGPMNVYEEREYPWLASEKTFLRRAIDGGKWVLGICLGAQLLATVLNSRVTRNSNMEIGWFPVEWTHEARAAFKALPARTEVFHWHGDTFELPLGATRIAASEACVNQGFVYEKRVLALQFHLEVTAASAQSLIQNCGNDLAGGHYVQSATELVAEPARFARVNGVLEKILNAWLEQLKVKN